VKHYKGPVGPPSGYHPTAGRLETRASAGATGRMCGLEEARREFKREIEKTRENWRDHEDRD
jgi:hypothetical protein